MGESDCDAAHKWGEWGEAWISHPRQPRSGSAGSGPGSGSPMPKDIRPGIPWALPNFPSQRWRCSPEHVVHPRLQRRGADDAVARLQLEGKR